ncbi:MAG: SDR family oxidoreductase [Armatimonadetes bacterium]|nr:SDR family oxidoreductase [Armatimonadota bacterium]
MSEKTFGKGARVLILGATSGIARATALEFARRGFDLVLAGRDLEEMEILAADARVRCGNGVEIVEFDATNFDSHPEFWHRCGEVDGVICALGVMPPQQESERDWETCRAVIQVNYTACVSVLNLVANDFEARKVGFIAVLTSVAGERARKSNYIYGSAKSGLSAYTEGLRARLFVAGVSVTTVKPGPVDTAMTWGMEKLPLLVPPEKVASDIYRGVRRKADVVFSPAPWRLIMAIMRVVPSFIWKRLDF